MTCNLIIEPQGYNKPLSMQYFLLLSIMGKENRVCHLIFKLDAETTK